MKNIMKSLSLATAAAVSFSAIAADPTSVTVASGKVTVSNRVEGALYTGTLLKEDGISSLDFWTVSYMRYAPAGVPTYEGGTSLLRGQVRFSRSDVFGSGPVRIGTESGGSTAFLVENADLTLANKFIFGIHGCYIASYGEGASVKLTSVGAENTQNSIRLGRENTDAYSRIVLSLDPEKSDTLSRIELSGVADLILDGGTLKSRAKDGATFFTDMYNSSTVTVSKTGVTFDTEAGSDMRLGMPLKFEKEKRYQVIDTYSPVNASFESNKLSDGGWTIVKGNGEDGGINSNGAAFDTGSGVSWHTPAGSKYLMLRQGATLSCTVDVPSDGDWRVSFLCGCRPPETGAYSKGISTSVLIDGEVKHTFAAISADQKAHGFEVYSTEVFRLTKGEHVFALQNSNSTANRHMNFDDIKFERIGSISEHQGPLSKTGTGRMALESSGFTGTEVNVGAGEMLFDGASFSGTSLNVAAGATGELFDCTVSADSEISVASGGTLSFVDRGVNLVRNGRFEADGYLSYSEIIPKYWSITRETAAGEKSGSQGNGGTLSPAANGPVTPYGDTTIYLREGFSAVTEVSCPSAGRYTVSFALACRKYAQSHLLRVAVKVDGEVIGEIPPHEEGYYDYTRYTFTTDELPAGTHTLSISTVEGESRYSQGSIVFIDDVNMCRKSAAPGAVGGVINMESGSVLDLDFDGTAEIEKLFVDGEEINGGKAALSRAGVTVTGSGRVRAGDIPGIHVIVR